MKKSKKIVSVVLAAGEAKRMGKTKQLLPWGKQTLIEHVIEQHLQTEVPEVYVVLGANFEEIKNQIKNYPVKILENTAWRSGLSTSIVAAAHHFAKEKVVADGILIALADQPLLDADYLKTMLQMFDGSSDNIVATAYEKKCGVPAVFPISYLDALSGLSGDTGASQLINVDKGRITAVDPGEKAIDIDTPEVYHQVYRMFGSPEKG
ncbi:MAG: nucleotidyltransferase family protein [Flavobacteriaceae bacterium]|nr:nucleotidyltransferase family protein [Flavobacteriaceae bacterium]